MGFAKMKNDTKIPVSGRYLNLQVLRALWIRNTVVNVFLKCFGLDPMDSVSGCGV